MRVHACARSRVCGAGEGGSQKAAGRESSVLAVGEELLLPKRGGDVGSRRTPDCVPFF